MSRGRQAKAEDKQQFLQTNPAAVEHDVQISVEKNGIFELVATDGENPVDIDSFIDVDGNITFHRNIDVGGEDNGVHIFAIDFDGEDGPPGNQISRDGPPAVTASKTGIGVGGEDESNSNNRSIEDGEGIVFIADGEDGHCGCVLDGEDDFGFSGANIEFEVLNNKAGTVTLVMYEDGPKGPPPPPPPPNGDPFNEIQVFGPSFGVAKEIEIAKGSKGLAEDIGFYLGEGETYSSFEIFVDGDVRISLVGVDYSTDGEIGILTC